MLLWRLRWLFSNVYRVCGFHKRFPLLWFTDQDLYIYFEPVVCQWCRMCRDSFCENCDGSLSSGVVVLISYAFPFTLTYRLGFVYLCWTYVVCQWCRICCGNCDGSLSTSTESAMDSPYTRIPMSNWRWISPTHVHKHFNDKIGDGFLLHTNPIVKLTMDSPHTLSQTLQWQNRRWILLECVTDSSYVLTHALTDSMDIHTRLQGLRYEIGDGLTYTPRTFPVPLLFCV